MYKEKTCLGVIPARGGSKGIPRKNIKELGGKPLIAWTVEAARASKFLDYCVVSTDDEEIAAVARACGAVVPFMRPKDLATDSARALPVLQHAISWIKEHEGRAFDYCMMLQPTSPFRLPEDIDESIRLIVEAGADSVFAMKKLVDFSLAKLKVLGEGGRIMPLAEEEKGESKPRSELGAAIYKRNCAVYLTKSELIMAGDMFGRDSRAYVMPEERSLDINEPMDFEIAEFMVQRTRR